MWTLAASGRIANICLGGAFFWGWVGIIRDIPDCVFSAADAFVVCIQYCSSAQPLQFCVVVFLDQEEDVKTQHKIKDPNS